MKFLDIEKVRALSFLEYIFLSEYEVLNLNIYYIDHIRHSKCRAKKLVRKYFRIIDNLWQSRKKIFYYSTLLIKKRYISMYLKRKISEKQFIKMFKKINIKKMY